MEKVSGYLAPNCMVQNWISVFIDALKCHLAEHFVFFQKFSEISIVPSARNISFTLETHTFNNLKRNIITMVSLAKRVMFSH